MAHRALIRALHLVFSQLSTLSLANLCIFGALLPVPAIWVAFTGHHPILCSAWGRVLLATLLACWAWSCLSFFAAWVMRFARGGLEEGSWRFVRAWMREELPSKALAFLAFALFFAVNGSAVVFYGQASFLPGALRLALLCLTVSFGLWGLMAMILALGFGAEPGRSARDLLKASAFSPAAFLPSTAFALVLALWLSGFAALAVLRAFPGQEIWWVPVFLPLAFLPALSLGLLVAFLAFLAEEFQLASLGYPPPLAQLPSLRELFRPWEP